VVDLLKLYLAEHLQPLVQFLWVEHGYVLLDIAFLL
jgi:hypothetical protein